MVSLIEPRDEHSLDYADFVFRKKLRGRTILLLYTGPDEQHEIGVSLSSGKTLPTSILGNGVNAAVVNGVTILSWRTTAADRALRVGPLDIYFLGKITLVLLGADSNFSQIATPLINIGY